MNGVVLELAADQRRDKTGRFEPRPDPEPERQADVVGSIGLGGGGPGEPRPRSYRPPRPPEWLRLLFYMALFFACFVIGYTIGNLWKRVDEAAWGPGGY